MKWYVDKMTCPDGGLEVGEDLGDRGHWVMNVSFLCNPV